MSYKVYISSTYEDLKELRARARDAILTNELLPVGMEHYKNSEERPVDKCLKDVRRCDIYLGLIAFRYGFVPAGFDKSITQLEYEEAGEAGIPRLIFVISEKAAWPPRWVDKDRTKIDTFRSHLLSEHTSPPLDDPNDLKSRVLSALPETVSRLESGHHKAAVTGSSEFQFPPILPYLSDRSSQRDKLRLALSEECKQSLHCKPLVCFVHGHQHECHEEFLEKVRSDILPDLLNLRKRHDSIELLRIPWPDKGTTPEQRLELYLRDLGREVAQTDSPRTDLIVQGLNSYRKPVLLHSEIMTQNWSRDEEQFIEQWLDFWNALPDLVQGRQLFVFLCVRHSPIARSRLRSMISKPEGRARKFLKEQETGSSNRKNITSCVLPELVAVEYDDLDDWISEVANNFCTDPNQRSSLKRDLRMRIEQFYREQKTTGIPMQTLGKNLEDFLNGFKSKYHFGA